MINPKRLVALLLTAVLAVALAACGGGSGGETGAGSSSGTEKQTSSTEKASGEPTIVVKGGEPVGGVQELEYSAGDEIRFRVRSDVADEVHVHGYDLMEDVAAGGTVSFDFSAEIEGIFEVELEELGEQIAELRVNP